MQGPRFLSFNIVLPLQLGTYRLVRTNGGIYVAYVGQYFHINYMNTHSDPAYLTDLLQFFDVLRQPLLVF